MNDEKWIDVGASDELAGKPVQERRVGTKRFALTWRDGQFGAGALVRGGRKAHELDTRAQLPGL